MSTKAELEKEIKQLNKVLKKEQSRPTGHIVHGCTIDMGKAVESKLAVAEAVKVGRKRVARYSIN